jgi:cytochrome oxidase Cu insertion factor (SCO1/SenC/PrrC family)
MVFENPQERIFVMSTKVEMLLMTLAALLFSFPLRAPAATLQVGDKAPNFTLPDQYGHDVSLSQFTGKKNVVLAFYVLAFTSG